MVKGFTLLSSEVGGVATLTQAHTGCGGDNISPALEWINAPEGTRSFALGMHDIDAPTPSGYWHWMVYNIPASVSSLVSNAGQQGGALLPEGAVHGTNDNGLECYSGPYPPSGHGWHSYMVTLYALDCEDLGVEPSTPAGGVAFNIWLHTIEKCSLVFYYRNL